MCYNIVWRWIRRVEARCADNWNIWPGVQPRSRPKISRVKLWAIWGAHCICRYETLHFVCGTQFHREIVWGALYSRREKQRLAQCDSTLCAASPVLHLWNLWLSWFYIPPFSPRLLILRAGFRGKYLQRHHHQHHNYNHQMQYHRVKTECDQFHQIWRNLK